MIARIRSLSLPWLVVVALVADCARVPDYALPQVRNVDGPSAVPSDSISYRALSREDFRATGPPARMAGYADRMAAYTCANVVPSLPIAIRVEPAGHGYVATAPEFEAHAEMDRGCSWWNDAIVTSQTPAYILQHEQIHFALIEIAARELRRRGRALRVHGESVEAAHAAFESQLEELRGEIADSILRRNTELDRDTSAVYDPNAQQRWYERVTGELRR